MLLEVLGSGGSVTTPRPFCTCPACTQARAEGPAYSRYGPSVFVHGPNVLVDTPEEIIIQLNRSRVREIAACLYSHWHPDHTAGKRLFEHQMDWVGLPPHHGCTTVIIPQTVASTFKSSMAIMDHLEIFIRRGLVDLQVIGDDQEVRVNGYSIRPVQLAIDYVFGYQIRGDDKCILIIMDELKGWIPSAALRDTQFDLVYLPIGALDVNPVTGKRLIDARHPMLKGEQTIGETRQIMEQLSAASFVLSHIEEPDSITLDLADSLAEFFSAEIGRPVQMAYDTMVVNV